MNYATQETISLPCPEEDDLCLVAVFNDATRKLVMIFDEDDWESASEFIEELTGVDCPEDDFRGFEEEECLKSR